MLKNKYDLFLSLFFLTIIILMSGCSTSTTRKHQIASGIQEKNNGMSSENPSDFILGVGDTINIAVYKKKTSESIIGVGDTVSIKVYRSNTSEFKIGYGDTVKINVFRHSEFDRTVKIAQSGIISIPLIGNVKAGNKNETELKKEITQKLSKYIVDPQVTIEISAEQGLLLEDFSMEFKISAQKKGKIIFPLIGEVQADGRDIIEFREEIQQKLSKHIIDPRVEIDFSPLQDLSLDDFSLTTTIDYTGKIMFPLLGDLKAAGKGVYELRDEIAQTLSEYIVDPQVAVKVSEIKSQRYYVLGEVVTPGIHIMSRPTSLWEAVTQSGWFTDDADKKKVLLIRNENGEARFTYFDFQKMLKTGVTIQNNYLKTNDVIYVFPTFIADVQKFMLRLGNIVNPLLNIESGIVLWPDMVDALQGKEKETSSVIISP